MTKALRMVLIYSLYIKATRYHVRDEEDIYNFGTSEENTLFNNYLESCIDDNLDSELPSERLYLPLCPSITLNRLDLSNFPRFRSDSVQSNELSEAASQSQKDRSLEHVLMDYEHVENTSSRDLQNTHAKEGFVNHMVNSIELQSEHLFKEANNILKKVGKNTSSVYQRKYLETRSLFQKYTEQFEVTFLENTLDYDNLNNSVLSIFFDSEFYDDKPKLSFSEEKFNNILLSTNSTMFYTLDVKEGIDYEIFITYEFCILKKYCKVIPELITLEIVRFAPKRTQKQVLCHLRSLNVYLTNLDKISPVQAGFKDKIICLIEKIIISGTKIQTCDIKKGKSKSININSCGKKHRNFLYVFVYNLAGLIKNYQKEAQVGSLKNTVVNLLKLESLYLLFNHLLLGNCLYFQEYKKKINDFLTLINKNDMCVHCMVEMCVTILCGVETCSEISEN